MISECEELDAQRSEVRGDRRARAEFAIDPRPGRGRSTPSSKVPDAALTGRVQKQAVTLEANDGYRLAATHFRLPAPPRANLIVAPAIGVPQGFYCRFARFAAAAGYATLTLDYRGIGQSAPGNLKGVEISCLDWGQRDLAAAVTAMRDPSRPLYLVAHSFGGHAFGLLPDPSAVSAMYSFGTGAGWHGWMPPAERVKVLAMWHLLGPILTRWSGYLSWSRVGMGEDLPLGVYREWKRWCAYPNYFFGDPELAFLKEKFAAIRTPIAAAASIDDRWAPPRSRDALMAGFANAPIERFDIDPARMGLPPLGHMGYFRSEAQPLWLAALDWLGAVDRRNYQEKPVHERPVDLRNPIERGET